MNLRDLPLGEMNNGFFFELPYYNKDDGKPGTFESDMIPGFEKDDLYL